MHNIRICIDIHDCFFFHIQYIQPTILAFSSKKEKKKTLKTSNELIELQTALLMQGFFHTKDFLQIRAYLKAQTTLFWFI